MVDAIIPSGDGYVATVGVLTETVALVQPPPADTPSTCCIPSTDAPPPAPPPGVSGPQPLPGTVPGGSTSGSNVLAFARDNLALLALVLAAVAVVIAATKRRR